MGEIAKKVQDTSLKWYGHVMRREEHCGGRKAKGTEVQWRRKRGRPERRWLASVRDDIREGYCLRKTELHAGVYHQVSTPI